MTEAIFGKRNFFKPKNNKFFNIQKADKVIISVPDDNQPLIKIPDKNIFALLIELSENATTNKIMVKKYDDMVSNIQIYSDSSGKPIGAYLCNSTKDYKTRIEGISFINYTNDTSTITTYFDNNKDGKVDSATIFVNYLDNSSLNK